MHVYLIFYVRTHHKDFRKPYVINVLSRWHLAKSEAGLNYRHQPPNGDIFNFDSASHFLAIDIVCEQKVNPETLRFSFHLSVFV